MNAIDRTDRLIGTNRLLYKTDGLNERDRQNRQANWDKQAFI